MVRACEAIDGNDRKDQAPCRAPGEAAALLDRASGLFGRAADVGAVAGGSDLAVGAESTGTDPQERAPA
jgi:hypothetical protein